MYSPHYSNPETYNNPEPVGATGPLEHIPRRWLRLFVRVFVLVVLLSVGGTANRHWLLGDSTPPAETAPAGIAPSEGECGDVMAAYDRWMRTGAPVTEQQIRVLDANASEAAVTAGQDFVADLRRYPLRAIAILRYSVEEHVTTMRALKVALGRDASAEEQVIAANVAVVSLQDEFRFFAQEYCP